MRTAEEAQSFLHVAQNIQTERAAELVVLEQQLEQCKRELRILESKMVAARGRVVDADMGIAAMRLLMQEKGFVLNRDLRVQEYHQRAPDRSDDSIPSKPSP
ncbi:hypothetical protein AX17_001877 [Amanita inopinata Kibby_2008]|nr:hypothetical protein AX17_001877 [Amanita inopinata Kibby_2008]